MSRTQILWGTLFLALIVFFACRLSTYFPTDTVSDIERIELSGMVLACAAAEPVMPVSGAWLSDRVAVFAEESRSLPFHSVAERSSVKEPADLFRTDRQREFFRNLSPSERNRLVKLKSRFFVAARPKTIDFASVEGAEVYLTFSKTPDEKMKERLATQGIRLVEHITRTTWRAVAADLSALTAVDTLLGVEPVWPVDKWSPKLWAKYRNESAEVKPIECVIGFTEETPWGVAAAVLQAAGAETSDTGFRYGQNVYAVADYNALLSIAGAHPVCSVSQAPPPQGLHNAHAAALSNVDAIHAAPYGLTGTNIHVMVRDGGEVSLHPDFGSPARVTMVDNNGAHWHSTHVAGTIAGDGSGSASAKGMVPAAQIYSYDFYGDSADEMQDAKTRFDARISNHSYGHVIGWDGDKWNDNTSLFGEYSSYARNWDQVVYDEGLYVFKSAGNDRNDDGTGHPHDGTLYGDGEYYDCIDDQGSAKNIVTVGAVSDTGVMSSFSSFGPTDDGRVKPDVVANGVSLYSTTSASSYGSSSGTSMSSPTVCGVAALLLEQYQALHGGAWPSAAYLKGLLIHTAEDLGRPGPDYAFGWGLVDAEAAVDVIRNTSATHVLVLTGSLSEGGTDPYQVTVPSAATNLRVTVCWTDKEGSTSATDALVNDLDVVLIAPDSNTVHYPYVLPFAVDGSSPTNPATTGTNQWDNVEQIDVVSPVSGVWAVDVRGTTVPSGPQDYVLFINQGNVTVPILDIFPSDIMLAAPSGGSDSAALIVSNSGTANLTISLMNDSGAYTWADSEGAGGPVYNWIDISSLGSAVSLLDDDESPLIDIGFNFPFYGSLHSRFRIAANGGISFSVGELHYNNAALPSADAPEQSILPFWDDLNPGLGGSIRYHSTPERLVVSWLAVPRYGTTTPETFQVVLYSDGRIVYQYNDLNGIVTSATVGLQRDRSGPSIQVAYNESYLKNLLAVELTPWLSLLPDQTAVFGGSSTSVWFIASASNLSAGVYTANVTLICNDPVTPEVVIPVEFTVSAADTDGDGLPDWWEDLYYGGATNAIPSDTASNGVNTVLEAYIAGLDPTDPDAAFLVTGMTDGSVLHWDSVSGRLYNVYWSSNLLNGFDASPFASNLTSGVFTDTVHGANSEGFYQLEVELAP